MAKRRTQFSHPHWSRLETILKVLRGELEVAQAARQLGLSRMQLYRLETSVLRAALEAVTPGKRGPKPKGKDLRVDSLEEQVRALEREKELARLRALELERVNEEMRRREIGAGGGKKRKRPSRKAVSREVSPVDPRPGSHAIKGEDGAGRV